MSGRAVLASGGAVMVLAGGGGPTMFVWLALTGWLMCHLSRR